MVADDLDFVAGGKEIGEIGCHALPAAFLGDVKQDYGDFHRCGLGARSSLIGL